MVQKMKTRTRLLVVFLLFVGIIIAPSLPTAVRGRPREKYGLTLKGGGVPSSRFEWAIIRLCHRLHIRTKFDEEFDEALQEANDMVEEAKESVRQAEQKQEQYRKWIEMLESERNQKQESPVGP